MENASEVYYWLRLKRDFFKRHDVKILKAMPNGTEYLLFYLQLMVESIDHNGELRFSELIPYDEQMLAVITDTNVDTVRGAISVLKGMGLIEVWDDRTIYVTHVQELIGSQSKQAAKKMEYRRKKSEPELGVSRNEDTSRTNVLPMSKKCPTEIEKEIEIDKRETNKEKGFAKPSIEEVRAYIDEKHYHFDAETFWNFYESKGWWVGRNKMKSWKAACATWERSRTGEVKEHDFGEYGNAGW
ncbi:MAG: phage replisome organizer N-terminal domain-containing protein [Atopobiaceae bacterium]|nr:phage replisome organizer N-terminal domain-containing protein [Atopobiaceae bacterium]